jgi:malonate-semialdehyde dehydrogenase (acetylating)/methylmalonate-semialdehyde dehydrogenase
MAPLEAKTSTMTTEPTTNSIPTINNHIDGINKSPPTATTSSSYIPVTSPSTSHIIAQVYKSTKEDVDTAVQSSKKALESWSKLTIKSRVAILMKFNYLVKEHAQELAELIVQENGKNIIEALADVAKGNETVEYACSLPQLAQGKTLKVSSQVTCTDHRAPLGIVASIVPFNFPFMVPFWTLPIAIAMGNVMILKPSEKVPLTMHKTMDLLKEAGLPNGVVNLVHGDKVCVDSIIEHPDIRAVTFVGSSPVASIVSSKCHKLNKRVLALGGAKNHLIALPDCSISETARDVVVSSMGCAGQRCMAASVLIIVGNGMTQKKLLSSIVELTEKIELGTKRGQCGPVIDSQSKEKILKYIDISESKCGSEILVDGRKKMTSGVNGEEGGNWVGPTIIKHLSPDDAAMKEEIFGPVLSVYHAKTWTEAIQIENSNPFGNAACIYTSSGGSADWFTSRFRASMLGINVGIPVPREPFSFGGLYGTKSKYGDTDITGDGAMEFFTNRIKVTSKWILPDESETGCNNSSTGETGPVDHASFNGRM